MTKPSETSPQAINDDWVRQVNVRPTDYDNFRGDVDQQEGRLFGGLVLAQSVVAAGRTTSFGDIHSLHAYFLRAGQPKEPIDYGVERIREGRNFLTRRVTARQAGHTIFEASVSFVASEQGIAHQEPMPEGPEPEQCEEWWKSIAMPRMAITDDPMAKRMSRRWNNPIDLRAASKPTKEGGGSLPMRMVWGRMSGTLPEDPILHAAAMVFLSDSGLIATVAHHYGIWMPGGASASLDHTMWFHRPPRFDDWILYTSESPAGHAARAVIFAGMYNRSGERIASVAQEGIFRKPPAS
ncbi:MAG: thioesterase family protein [Dehalococcoidia bacterium]|nr:thioesterase family protein [Dehalococcoidia bacterium]